MSEQQPDQLVVNLIQNNEIFRSTNDKLRGQNADQHQELVALNTVNLERSLKIRALSRECASLEDSNKALTETLAETTEHHKQYVADALEVRSTLEAKIKYHEDKPEGRHLDYIMQVLVVGACQLLSWEASRYALISAAAQPRTSTNLTKVAYAVENTSLDDIPYIGLNSIIQTYQAVEDIEPFTQEELEEATSAAVSMTVIQLLGRTNMKKDITRILCAALANRKPPEPNSEGLRVLLDDLRSVPQDRMHTVDIPESQMCRAVSEIVLKIIRDIY